MSAAATWSPLCAPVEVRHADGVRVERFGLNRAHIGDPLRWRGDRAVTVVGDPWGRLVDPRDAAAIFAVMASAGRHAFAVTTHEPDAMRRWLAWVEMGARSAVALYNAAHEVHYPSLDGRVDPPTPEVRFIYDVGADRVNPWLRGAAARHGRMGEFHWRAWPLGSVTVAEVRS